MDHPAEGLGVATDLLAQILRLLYVCTALFEGFDTWAEKELGVTPDKATLLRHIAIEAYLDEKYSDDTDLKFPAYLNDLRNEAINATLDVQLDY